MYLYLVPYCANSFLNVDCDLVGVKQQYLSSVFYIATSGTKWDQVTSDEYQYSRDQNMHAIC